MKDGCIVANSGHFNDEINIPALDEQARGAARRCGRSSRSTRCTTVGGSTCWPTAGC